MKTITAATLSEPVEVDIEDVVQEEVDGVPTLFLLMRGTADGEERRMVLTRELAEDLVSMLGPHPLITEFFKTLN